MDRLKPFVQIIGSTSTNSKWAGFDKIGNISEECLALSNGNLLQNYNFIFDYYVIA